MKQTKEIIENKMLDGFAIYSEDNRFVFEPGDPVFGQTDYFKKRGIGLQMSDGTFEFIPKPKERSQSVLLKKLPYGRLSRTKDGAIQLTLKIYPNDGVDIAKAMRLDSKSAVDTVKEMNWSDSDGDSKTSKPQNRKTL